MRAQRRTKETEPRKSTPRKRKGKIEPPQDMLQGFDPFQPPPGSRGINEVLENARSSLNRLSPQAAYDLLAHPKAEQPPAILIDIRPQKQRSEEGEIEGAVVIERNVLEWRFDPRSDAKMLKQGGIGERYDTRAIVFCSESYTSSLAARCLQELGLWNATDLVGGYRAWREEGLGGVPSLERGGKAGGGMTVGGIPPTSGHTGVS
jgi:rhodanese-related sulfurtransferase